MGWGSRGWVEIIEGILETCQRGALKTHVMYQCNLNSRQIAQYTQFLQSHKLLLRSPDPHSKRILLKTTEAGRRYMSAYKELESLFK